MIFPARDLFLNVIIFIGSRKYTELAVLFLVFMFEMTKSFHENFHKKKLRRLKLIFYDVFYSYHTYIVMMTIPYT